MNIGPLTAGVPMTAAEAHAFQRETIAAYARGRGAEQANLPRHAPRAEPHPVAWLRGWDDSRTMEPI